VIKAERRRKAGGAPVPNNLPVYLTSFIGRAAALRSLKSLLESSRVVTLTGSGGAGKSRLAVELARAWLDRWPDGAWWVELAPLNDSDQVPGAVLATMELPGQGPAMDVVTAWLADKRALLLMDNCEHLVEASARFCETALKRCPALTIIATSRESLRVPGEALFPVSSLAPDDSLRLFEARGRLNLPDFKIGQSNLEPVTEICRRLDGLPLAIELAAARLGMLTEREIVSQLADRFSLLTGGARTALERQQTMRATIDWSHRLLTEDEATLFRRLSVFRGGFTLESADAVCGDGDEPVLSLLTALVHKSMIEVERPEVTASRYRLLESLRTYADERLLGAADVQVTRRRHYEYFAHALESRTWNLAESNTPEITAGTEEWKRREWDNLLAALGWSRDNAEDMGLSFAVNVTLAGYMDSSQTRSLLEDLLDRSPAAGLPRARAMRRASVAAGFLGDYEGSFSLAEAAELLARELGDAQELAYVLTNIGQSRQVRGEFDAASRAFDEAISLARGGGNGRLASIARECVGELALQRGDYLSAREILAECVAESRSTGQLAAMATILSSLAQAQLGLGDAAAAASLQESLSINRDFNIRASVIACLAGFSCLAGARGDDRRALRLGAVAHRMSGEWSMRLDPWQLDQLEAAHRQSRTRLGTSRSDEAWKDGWALNMERAIEYALGDAEPEVVVDAGPLTHRQREVAQLVAAGMTNRQIADRLFITERSAEGHVERIRNRLELRSRAEVAAWAVARGLAAGASGSR
jgi:predicted ATPase/DNA-binding CsgD family transcriptional regulator